MFSARLAGMADVPAVTRITVAAYEGYVPLLGMKPLPMTADHGAMVAAGGVWMVARDGAEVAVMELEREADHLLIFNLAVLPEAQGGGIGRWMLGFIEERARSEGLGEVRLYTNPLMERNIRVYGEAGYSEVGRRPNPYRPGFLVVDMAKRV